MLSEADTFREIDKIAFEVIPKLFAEEFKEDEKNKLLYKVRTILEKNPSGKAGRLSKNNNAELMEVAKGLDYFYKRIDTVKSILEKPHPLSKEQRKAVLSDKRYLLINAGAGTGKTETLTRRIIYLILFRKVEPREIVAFTFTEKAAQSMKDRIYRQVRQLGGEEVCHRLGEMYIGTIHAFCLKILQEHFGFGNYNVLDENQEMAYILREGWNLGLNEFRDEDAGLNEFEEEGEDDDKSKEKSYADKCRDFLKSVNVVYNELIDKKALKKKDKEFYELFAKYEDGLNEHKLLTFGRMVALAVEKLRQEPEKLSYIKHLIVDEYQDINRAQEALIETIGQTASVFVVGDPRQCIYQWRGSDESCFFDFPKNFKETEKVFLVKNRRSGKKIVEIANKFADTFKCPSYEPLESVRDDEGVVLYRQYETPYDEARSIISEIKHYQKKLNCRYSDFAILMRSVKTTGPKFIEELKRNNIPYIVAGKLGLFQRDEAKALGYLFSWLWDEGFWFVDPYNKNKQIKGEILLDEGIKLWYQATGLTPPLTPIARHKLNLWKKEVLNDSYRTLIEIFQEVLNILGYKELDPDNKLHAAIMANIGRFSSMLADYESSIRLGGIKPTWEYLIKGLCWYMNTYATGAYEEQQPDDISGIDAVQILTVHQAKGLEWPIVYIPALVERRFPSSLTGMPQDWWISEELFDVNRYNGGIEEERRVFYVALTRARDMLVLSGFKRITKAAESSIFIKELGSGYLAKKPPSAISINIRPVEEEDSIQTFSPGEIINYLKCPYFYRLREIWNYKPGIDEALGYGKSLHHCLHVAAELLKDRRRKPEKDVKEVIEREFHLPYASRGAVENMKKKAEEILLSFVIKHRDELSAMSEVESSVEFPVQNGIISGKVDVVLRDEDTAEVWDYKTSEEVTTFEEVSLQIQLYALGLQKQGKPVKKGAVVYLNSEEGEQIKYVKVGEKELKEAQEKAEKCIKSLREQDFKAAPQNGYCSRCDYRSLCRWAKI